MVNETVEQERVMGEKPNFAPRNLSKVDLLLFTLLRLDHAWDRQLPLGTWYKRRTSGLTNPQSQVSKIRHFRLHRFTAEEEDDLV